MGRYLLARGPPEGGGAVRVLDRRLDTVFRVRTSRAHARQQKTKYIQDEWQAHLLNTATELQSARSSTASSLAQTLSGWQGTADGRGPPAVVPAGAMVPRAMVSSRVVREGPCDLLGTITKDIQTVERHQTQMDRAWDDSMFEADAWWEEQEQPYEDLDGLTQPGTLMVEKRLLITAVREALSKL